MVRGGSVPHQFRHPHPEEQTRLGLRLEGRGTRRPRSVSPRTLVLRDADPSRMAPQDEGSGRVFRSPISSGIYSLLIPALTISPSSRARPGIYARQVPSSPAEIPALRCAPAGMTGLGWKMERGPHRRQVRPRRTLPERCSAAEPCPGSSAKMRRAAAHSCLKTKWKRASRGVLALDPGHPSAVAPGFRGRAAGRHFGLCRSALSGSRSRLSAALRPG